MTRVYLFAILMWCSCFFAIARGGWAERTVAIAYLVASILSQVEMSPANTRFHHVEISVLLIDAVLFAILLGVALFSEKYWPLWITAMHGVALLSHFGPVMPAVVPLAYANAISLWAWPIMIWIALAAWQHSVKHRGTSRLPT